MFVFLALGFALASQAVGAVVGGVWTGIEWAAERPQRRRARIETELNRTEAQMRATVLELASELGNAELEARKRMIQESYLASGEINRGDH